jgi:hypothetical protein
MAGRGVAESFTSINPGNCAGLRWQMRVRQAALMKQTGNFYRKDAAKALSYRTDAALSKPRPEIPKQPF